MNSNPKPMLKYFASNVVANRWLNIEDYEHPLYWVKVKISLSAHAFSNKVHNWLIMYLECQKRNPSNIISKLKETWTDLNLRLIKSIFNPDQLHRHCHFPKEVEEYFSKKVHNMKDTY